VRNSLQGGSFLHKKKTARLGNNSQRLSPGETALFIMLQRPYAPVTRALKPERLATNQAKEQNALGQKSKSSENFTRSYRRKQTRADN
jgi:hypothetical protein